MAKQILVETIHGEQILYTQIETLEDIADSNCIGDPEDLIKYFNDDKTIIVNEMGGYCFFTEGYHTICDAA